MTTPILDAFEERDGWPGSKTASAPAQDIGLGRVPSCAFSINAAWLTAVMLAVDLLAWTQTVLLHDHRTLAKAEPKTLRYRLLHVAARLVRGGRRLRLRLEGSGRATALAAAFTRCAALPQPAR